MCASWPPTRKRGGARWCGSARAIRLDSVAIVGVYAYAYRVWWRDVMASLQRLLRQQCQPRHQFRRPLYSSLLGLHACNATHPNTHNVQQGIRRQDGHGAAGERAAVSVYAGVQLLRTRSAVLYKLVLFALLMAVVPIATYFGTLNYLWDGALCLWFPVPSMPLQTPGRMSLGRLLLILFYAT